jgi:transcriptional regulator with XRE-family HTH domain
MGRPSSKPRGAYGKHLSLREVAGLSQRALAQRLGVDQSNITFWEHWDKPPRGDVLPALAQALNVSIDELLQFEAPKPKPAPVGKARITFERLVQLPRRQQDQILKVINALIAQHDSSKAA